MELIFKEPGPEKKNQKYLENFKKSLGKDECMCQCTTCPKSCICQ